VIKPLAMKGSLPSCGFVFPLSARVIFSIGFVLLVFHLFAMVAHYGLFNKNGRKGFLKADQDDYPYFPLQERVVVGVAIMAAILAALYVMR